MYRKNAYHCVLQAPDRFQTIATIFGSARLIVFGSHFIAVGAVRFMYVRLYRYTLSPTYAAPFPDNSASIWSDKSTKFTILSLASNSAIVDYH